MKGLGAAPWSCGGLKAPVPSLLPVLGFPFSFLGVCSLWAPLASAVDPEQPGMKGLMPFQERTHSFLSRCLPHGWAVWWPRRDSNGSRTVWLARDGVCYSPPATPQTSGSQPVCVLRMQCTPTASPALRREWVRCAQVWRAAPHFSPCWGGLVFSALGSALHGHRGQGYFYLSG